MRSIRFVKRILVFTLLLVFFLKPINQQPILRYISGDGYLNWQYFVTMHDKNFPIVPVAYWQRMSCDIKAINTCLSAGKIASGLHMTMQNVTHPRQSLS